MYSLRRSLLAAVALFPALASAADVPVLTPAEAAARVQAGGAVLIDVREPVEWRESGVVQTAYLLALSDLREGGAQWRDFLRQNRDKELILYCRTGNRSGQAAEILAAKGFNVANAGGLNDWVAAGQPTRKAEDTVPAP